MSKVYSFRLNYENPREAQAREVIDAWVREGYSLRYVVVEALLKYSAEMKNSKDYCLIVEQIQSLLTGYTKSEIETINPLSLSNTFLAGVKRSKQNGINA